MALITGDFVTRLSGGSGNSSGNAALGGAKSSTAASTSVDGLFDQVTSAEAGAWSVEYRCIYLHNGNGTSTMLSAVAWVGSQTSSASTSIDIAVGSSAVNGTEQTIGSETTAPTGGVTFVAAANQGAGIALGDIPAGQHRAIWLRRTVASSATATVSDAWQLNYAADYTS